MNTAYHRKVVLSFILIVFLGWFVYSCYQCTPAAPNPDSTWQMKQALLGQYNNWKPAIHSWIFGRLEWLFPGDGFNATIILQLLLLGGSVSLISLYYARQNYKYATLILTLPLFFNTKCLILNSTYNDVLAAGLYLAYIAALLWSGTIKQRPVKILSVMGAFLILALGMALRHNSIPMVVLLATWGAWRLGIRLTRAILIALCFFVIAGITNHIVTYRVLEAEPSYPLKSPLADDLVNLSILNGKWSEYCLKQGADTLPPPHECYMLCPQVANAGKPIDPFTISPDLQERKQVYDEMLAAWKKQVSEQPLSYIALKAFFYHQHLLEGRCLPIVCKAFRKTYPHVRIHMEAESLHYKAWVNRQFIVMSLIPLCCFGLVIVLPIWLRIRNISFTSLPQIQQDAFAMMSAALIYCSTFLPFVLAATELRYYIIRATLCALAAPMFVLPLLCKKAKNP